VPQRQQKAGIATVLGNVLLDISAGNDVSFLSSLWTDFVMPGEPVYSDEPSKSLILPLCGLNSIQSGHNNVRQIYQNKA